MTHPAAAAALQLVGCPFRLRGRDPSTGLDCVGLVGEVIERVGGTACLPLGYGLRNTDISALMKSAAASGLRSGAGPTEPGDIALFDLGFGQFHLAVAVGSARFIHAHAGLRKVVCGPVDPRWQRIANWRIPIEVKD
ncbi:hypothetical protein [Croceicoccus gelatinilyticus]|uniref:hypothetical protein n=1 Tax=Croceicoccus gelatinilyticus TaxID=2835536 RepID=UPI001BCB542E|nr:hypothetical protein [Croceicoccus gelatinilyticus]MBS7668214.1 C40 family peptidase [Croceicoccus gelatinilyticus]